MTCREEQPNLTFCAHRDKSVATMFDRVDYRWLYITFNEQNIITV